MKQVEGVLGEIVESTIERIALLESTRSFEQLVADSIHVPQNFEKQIGSRAPSIIAEVKFASPSEGRISDLDDPVAVAKEYLDAGATALSVLTESEFFDGSLDNLKQIRQSFPKSFLLMKDFVIGRYQLALARNIGADAVLLIAALFDTKELGSIISEAKQLGLSALVEVHDKEEMIRACEAKATLIGVNNRDLKTLNISLQTSETLVSLAPQGAVLVTESGISNGKEVNRFSNMGYHGFLIGTSLMKTGMPGIALKKVIGELK